MPMFFVVKICLRSYNHGEFFDKIDGNNDSNRKNNNIVKQVVEYVGNLRGHQQLSQHHILSSVPAHGPYPRPVDPSVYPLVNLLGDTVHVMESIRIPVREGTYLRESRVVINFLAVDVPSFHNAILSQPRIAALRVVPSSYHLELKLLTPRGARECKADQLISQHCYSAQLQEHKKSAKSMPIHIEDLRDNPRQQCGTNADMLGYS
ncbi:hypothetical protein NE237_023327 [Protea cynaroides]|uniref:Uncharacterized protein n=1 Tax=Protea cynaroides TaxID=273540 RepID=A0A9Q0HBZ5_9MAGN|nr:hypothetical protein NE237_023327 [Protea cynaroides]